MDRIPTATDPTKINLRQADLLRRTAEDTWQAPSWLKEVRPSVKALADRGLIVYQPNVNKTTAWVVTDLGRQVLAGGLVHTDTERDADGNTHLFVFLNGKQVGEVKPVHGPAPSWRRAGWQWISLQGVRSLIYPTKNMAVASLIGETRVAGGVR